MSKASSWITSTALSARKDCLKTMCTPGSTLCATRSTNGMRPLRVSLCLHTNGDFSIERSHISEFYYDGTIINGAPMFIPNLQED